MNTAEEKSRRLAEWHETLNNTIIDGSVSAWLGLQLHEVNNMLAEKIINDNEARELRSLVDQKNTAVEQGNYFKSNLIKDLKL